MASQTLAGGEVSFSRSDERTLTIQLSGSWRLRRGVSAASAVEAELRKSPVPGRVVFDARDLGEWGSSLLAFLIKVTESCSSLGIEADLSGLPEGLVRLQGLALAVPEREGARVSGAGGGLVERFGRSVLEYFGGAVDFLNFFGLVSLAFWALLRGRARFRHSDLMLTVQECGANAFGIVTLISFLVGTILAFMGAVQLEQFGATVYIANLVGIGMLRDMGAMMTGIIMAGRTGAAFAAQLGAMNVSQEIDALTTTGISPIEFLVLPRVIALTLMMPLLCLYSDFVGILGGAAVGSGMMGLSLVGYFHDTIHAVTLGELFGGLLKSVVYGVIIAVVGCLRGFQCSGSSSAVGDAATAAVVSSIVYIVVACGLFALIFYVLGI